MSWFFIVAHVIFVAFLISMVTYLVKRCIDSPQFRRKLLREGAATFAVVLAVYSFLAVLVFWVGRFTNYLHSR